MQFCFNFALCVFFVLQLSALERYVVENEHGKN